MGVVTKSSKAAILGAIMVKCRGEDPEVWGLGMVIIYKAGTCQNQWGRGGGEGVGRQMPEGCPGGSGKEMSLHQSDSQDVDCPLSNLAGRSAGLRKGCPVRGTWWPGLSRENRI